MRAAKATVFVSFVGFSSEHRLPTYTEHGCRCRARLKSGPSIAYLHMCCWPIYQIGTENTLHSSVVVGLLLIVAPINGYCVCSMF